MNPFNLRTIQESKASILDVKAKDSHGRWINVEIQIDNDGSFADRSLYSWARSYAGQLTDGERYADLAPSVCINVLDFAIFPKLPGYHSCFQITEVDMTVLLHKHTAISKAHRVYRDFTADRELMDIAEITGLSEQEIRALEHERE